MKPAAPRILFVGHDASRSGAPILLLHFLKWFKENVGWPFDVLLCAGGPMTADYQALASTVVTLNDGRSNHGRGRRILRRLGRESWIAARHYDAIRKRLADRYDLIYINSVAGAGAMPIVQKLDGPVLCHVHELDYVFRHMVDATAARALLERSTRYIACAQAVANYLTSAHGVSTDQIDVVHEFIELADTPSDGNHVRTELNLPADAILIGGAGKLGWRKGTDLFIQIAHRVRQLRPRASVHFIWLGGGGDHLLTAAQLEHDVRALGLESIVRFVGVKENPASYFAAMDVLALPSREDPFPLVCLEAAAGGKPIVCFESAGGMSEFVETDCGFTVPYLEVETFAGKLVQLIDDESLRRSMGAAAHAKVLRLHTVAAAAPQLFQSIQRTLGIISSPVGRGQSGAKG